MQEVKCSVKMRCPSNRPQGAPLSSRRLQESNLGRLGGSAPWSSSFSRLHVVTLTWETWAFVGGMETLARAAYFVGSLFIVVCHSKGATNCANPSDASSWLAEDAHPVPGRAGTRMCRSNKPNKEKGWMETSR